MSKSWKYQFRGNVIEITVSGVYAKLLVNGRVRDKATNIFMLKHLRCTLEEGESVDAAIIGGLLEIECQLHIGEQLLKPESVN